MHTKTNLSLWVALSFVITSLVGLSHSEPAGNINEAKLKLKNLENFYKNHNPIDQEFFNKLNGLDNTSTRGDKKTSAFTSDADFEGSNIICVDADVIKVNQQEPSTVGHMPRSNHLQKVVGFFNTEFKKSLKRHELQMVTSKELKLNGNNSYIAQSMNDTMFCVISFPSNNG
jgi:hypothetical protein